MIYITRIKIELTREQEEFCSYVKNRKCEEKIMTMKELVMRLMEMYLNADTMRNKRLMAKRILKLRSDCMDFANSFNVLDIEELKKYANQK